MKRTIKTRAMTKYERALLGSELENNVLHHDGNGETRTANAITRIQNLAYAGKLRVRIDDAEIRSALDVDARAYEWAAGNGGDGIPVALLAEAVKAGYLMACRDLEVGEELPCTAR